MSSAIHSNLDQSKILSSSNGLIILKKSFPITKPSITSQQNEEQLGKKKQLPVSIDLIILLHNEPPKSFYVSVSLMKLIFFFKKMYFTWTEKQVLTTYTNLSRFCFLGRT